MNKGRESNYSVRNLLLAPLGALLVVLALGCEDETIIEVEAPFFEDPPAGAQGFLGYDEQEAKLAVCGNCHVGQQGEWDETIHAEAWDGLQSSGHAQSFCEGCHTVGPNGNAAVDGGWASTQDPRYHDVQCESCHGPGQTHVLNPDAAGKPLASIAITVDEATGSIVPAQDGSNGGCGDCHEGTHHPFVEEWAQSPHAEAVAYPAGREGCEDCHKGQATLVAWGENANYIEKDSAEPVGQVCAVCHDPHDATKEHQLRFEASSPTLTSNLCAQCHNRRTEPDPDSSHGLHPHSPEAALVFGEAGWFPPGANIGVGQIRATHGSESNTGLCAQCHLPEFEVTDAATGDFVFQSVGHLFRPIPCLDPEGLPLPFGQDCDLAPPARTYEACTGGPCHGSEDTVFAVLTAATGRIERWVDELHELLLEVDPNLDDEGGEIDADNPIFTVAEGAFFNMELAEFGNEDFGTDNVIGSTVHNPFLVEALLIASIEAVEDEYDVQANVGVNLEEELQRVLTRAGR